MAEEGLVERALGAEAEERETDPAPPGLDPVAAAAAFQQAGDHPGLAEEMKSYFAELRQLIQLQQRHFDEERRLSIHAARRKQYADRIRNGLATLALAVSGLVLVWLAATAWTASRSHRLVVDAFSSPADLARDGVTGQVVAARLLDRLRELERNTRSPRPPTSYESNWSGDAKIEIPQTGLTLGEVERVLRERLGHESHVTGEIIRTSSGIRVSARYGEESGETFEGPADQLDALIAKAAEAIYRVSQPYRYAVYLSENGRNDEALAVANSLAASGPTSERAWAHEVLAGIAIIRGDAARARQEVAAAKALGGPGGEHAVIYAAAAELWAGHEEALLGVSRYLDSPKFYGQLSADYTSTGLAEDQLIGKAYLAAQLADFRTAADAYQALTRSSTVSLKTPFYYAQAAWAFALNHDLDNAQRSLAQAGPMDLDFYAQEGNYGWYALPTYQLAAERGDWPTALAELRRVDGLIEGGKAKSPAAGLLQPVLLKPLLARALLRTGDGAAARTVIGATALDCYLCLRVRAEIAASDSDVAASDRWFKEAVRQAPSVPFAYTEWGDALLGRGDAAQALQKFEAAIRVAPRDADAFKGAGDALARLGRRAEAMSRYKAALSLAPAWPELQRLARG